jgi:hypothetical protein
MKQTCAFIHRDEEAVSAAIGTVLLFAGVLSIIGVMMATMIPVINELQGSIERSDMASQMFDLSVEIDQLAATGMPGDHSDAILHGIEGKFNWQNIHGGVWISASWHDGSSLRLDDALDLDRRIDVRHPTGEVAVICFDDMRLGSTIDSHYRIPAIEGRLVVSPDSGLAQSQGPMKITYQADGEETLATIADHEIWSTQTSGVAESWLSLDSPAQVLLLKADGGTTLMQPQSTNPATGEGRAWRIPLLAGHNEVTMVSRQSMEIDWRTSEQEGSTIIVEVDAFHEEGTTWQQEWDVSENTLLTIQSSTDARLLFSHDSVQTGDIALGSTFWPGNSGSMLAKTFQPPGIDGTVIMHNPSQSAVTVRWGTGATSVAAGSTAVASWPPQGTVSPELKAEDPINIIWSSGSLADGAERTGLDIIPANDTGAASGHSHYMEVSNHSTVFHAQVAGVVSRWSDHSENITRTSSHSNSITSLTNLGSAVNLTADVEEDGLRVLVEMGDVGMLSIPHDGQQRCRYIGIRASGWISTVLPWEELDTGTNTEAELAWAEGTHPASIEIKVLGSQGDENFAVLSTAWAMHAPRLVYTFSSSISGLEVAMRAGAVVTNHPEVKPSIIKSPIDRSGPGPRFAVTIPIMTPSQGSDKGVGEFDVELELLQRISLASASAHEVRRGWDGPYGTALAASVSKDLRYSEDWTAAPLRLDMLNDYKGWVPNPSMDSSETIFHAQGEDIQFSLQVSLVSCTLDGI